MNNISERAMIYDRVRISESTISDGAVVADDCDLRNVVMGTCSEFGRRCVVRNATLGVGSYFGSNCSVMNVEIGKYCCMSSDINIYGSDVTHDYRHTSMYIPYWYKRVLGVEVKGLVPNKTVIGNDVWIGCNVSVLGGLKIGDGCVIGAGSVVCHDVEPYTIVAGNPAKVLKKRFSDDFITRLLRLSWWNLPTEILRDAADLLNTELNDEVLEKLEKIADICVSE